MADPRTIYVDVDETLICHDLSKFPEELAKEFCIRKRSFKAVPHTANIKLLIKFYKLGYDVYVWSKTGKSWAKEVVSKLNIKQYVKGCLTKPDFHMDDLDCSMWMGPRLWRSPTGNSSNYVDSK